jgi:signal transduction histidine kinase/putative methionine-R-sulfoxide reductase with GAF domain
MNEPDEKSGPDAAWESLRAVIEDISGELLLRPLLTRIVRHACDLIGADNGTIGLYDPERDVIRTEAAYRMPPNELGAEMKRGMGLAGQVLATGEPVVLGRYGDVDNPTQPGLAENAVVGVPIHWHGELIGFFGIGSAPGDGRRFSAADVEMLSLFARHAAIAITNARRYEFEQRRTERFALLARVGRLLTTDLQREEVLSRAADAIHELLGYPYVAVMLVDETDPNRLLMRAVSGIASAEYPAPQWLPIGRGLVGACAREKRAFLVNDVSTDPRYVPTPGLSGIQAEVVTPILLGSRLLGVLNVESGQPFSREDVASLGIVADQMAVALENSRLFADTRRALQETQLLFDTSARMSAASDTMEVVVAYLEQVAAGGRFACTVTEYEWASDEAEEAGEDPVYVRILGVWTPAGGLDLTERRHPYQRDSLDNDLEAGRTVAMANVHVDPRATRTLRRIQRESGRPALALIPLRARGTRRLGHVILSAPVPTNWAEDELRRYQITATHLATVLDNRKQQTTATRRQRQVAVLEERARLARDLHDSVTQQLFSIHLMAQTIPAINKRDPAEAERRLERLLNISQSALAEMRALLVELGPASALPDAGRALVSRLRRDGLAATLASHIAEVGEVQRTLSPHAPTVTLEAAGYRPLSDPETEEALLRIAQEALSNAVKYARATHIEIRLTTDVEAVHLAVRDNGQGIVAEKKRVGGLGLNTMRERAEARGGTLSIASEPGEGTAVSVTIPVRPARQTKP